MIGVGSRPPLLKGCPKEIENLMTTCWSKTVENRPSMRTVVERMRRICSFFPDATEPLAYKYADNVKFFAELQISTFPNIKKTKTLVSIRTFFLFRRF